MSVGNDHVAGALIREIRTRSGLTQAELARRTGLHSSVLSAYEHGHRQPAVAALVRIARAADLDVGLTAREAQVDVRNSARVLAQVLDLAEQLPYRPRRELRYPPLVRLAA